MNAIKLSALAILCVLAMGGARAADVPFLTIDRSTQGLIDPAAAQAAWVEHIAKVGPKRLAKLYPTARWGFLSQVEGGFTSSKICVVTARAAMVPRTGKQVVFKPEKMATAFDALPGATQEQCQTLAKTKLDEAVSAVMSSLVAPR
jgi:hypothetical protein